MEIGLRQRAGGEFFGKWGGHGGRNLSASSHSPSALCWPRKDPAPRSSLGAPATLPP